MTSRALIAAEACTMLYVRVRVGQGGGGGGQPGGVSVRWYEGCELQLIYGWGNNAGNEGWRWRWRRSLVFAAVARIQQIVLSSVRRGVAPTNRVFRNYR